MIDNGGRSPVRAQVSDALDSGRTKVVAINPGGTHGETADPVGSAFGWYDLTFTLEDDPSFLRRFTGHLEDGNPSRTRGPDAPRP
jgi:phospholipase C